MPEDALKTSTIEPLGDRVAIRPDEEVEMKGMIYLPGNARDKPIQGTVIAVGSGRDDGEAVIPLTLKVGDVVIYGKYAGTAIEWEDKELILIHEVDVLARVK